MAFQRSNPPSPQADGPPPQYDPSELVRIAGLWPSASGKALIGSINLNEPRFDPKNPVDIPAGDEIVDMIQNCMQNKLELKFLVFENKPGQKGPRYALLFAIGQDERQRQQQPAQGPQRPQAQQNDGPPPPPTPPRWGWAQQPAEAAQNDSPEPEAPRPQRRVAPRR